MQRELFRKVARATEQGIPSWVPVGVVAADGTETRAYAAVYPLTSTSSSFSPLTPARDVGGKAASGSGGGHTVGDGAAGNSAAAGDGGGTIGSGARGRGPDALTKE
ncbi:unnamed protein product, partial [Ectocarpus sp. 12 AP-2014]